MGKRKDWSLSWKRNKDSKNTEWQNLSKDDLKNSILWLAILQRRINGTESGTEISSCNGGVKGLLADRTGKAKKEETHSFEAHKSWPPDKKF